MKVGGARTFSVHISIDVRAKPGLSRVGSSIIRSTLSAFVPVDPETCFHGVVGTLVRRARSPHPFKDGFHAFELSSSGSNASTLKRSHGEQGLTSCGPDEHQPQTNKLQADWGSNSTLKTNLAQTNDLQCESVRIVSGYVRTRQRSSVVRLYAPEFRSD